MPSTHEKEPRDRRASMRRLLAGTAIAVAGTAAMVAVTLPMNASGSDGGGPRAAASPSQSPAAPPSQPASSSAPSAGVGGDALSPDEIDRARQLALGADRALRTTSEDVEGRAGAPQFVTADLADGEGGKRVAEVVFYDYRDDRAVRKTVDLGSGEVTGSESAGGVQPPMSEPEAVEALKVLLAGPLGDGVRQDFKAATGEPLTSATRLGVQGMSYDSPPPGDAGLADCAGAHRCVRLFTRVRGGPWIDTRRFVVDLSARTALRLP